MTGLRDGATVDATLNAPMLTKQTLFVIDGTPTRNRLAETGAR